jgi:flagellar motility protein MotE (MotC chaperone)
MTQSKKSNTARKVKRGTLVLLAVFLVGSAILRIGLEAGPAIAREVASLGDSEKTEGAQTPVLASHGSAELQTMLAAFQQREERLERREAEFEDRMKALEIADRAIEQKLADLKKAENDLLKTLALADGAAETDVGTLTAVYEKMKPKDAAALFEEMDPTFAAGFLARMRPEAAAGVMAGLSPEAAYTISVVLAGRNGNVPRE